MTTAPDVTVDDRSLTNTGSSGDQAPGGEGTLPRTGSEVTDLVATGVAAVTAGTALAGAAKRRLRTLENRPDPDG